MHLQFTQLQQCVCVWECVCKRESVCVYVREREKRNLTVVTFWFILSKSFWCVRVCAQDCRHVSMLGYGPPPLSEIRVLFVSWVAVATDPDYEEPVEGTQPLPTHIHTHTYTHTHTTQTHIHTYTYTYTHTHKIYTQTRQTVHASTW